MNPFIHNIGRENVIKDEVDKIQQLRDQDLKNFIETKETLEMKVKHDQEVQHLFIIQYFIL